MRGDRGNDRVSGIPFHHDTNWNDAQSNVTADILFPACSAVTYLSDAGGPLVVVATSEASLTPLRVVAKPPTLYDQLLERLATAAPYAETYTSLPYFGKHNRFKGNLYHGVLRGNSGHGETNERLSIILTFWRHKYKKIRPFPHEHLARVLRSKAGSADPESLTEALDALRPFPEYVVQGWHRFGCTEAPVDPVESNESCALVIEHATLGRHGKTSEGEGCYAGGFAGSDRSSRDVGRINVVPGSGRMKQEIVL